MKYNDGDEHTHIEIHFCLLSNSFSFRINVSKQQKVCHSNHITVNLKEKGNIYMYMDSIKLKYN